MDKTRTLTLSGRGCKGLHTPERLWCQPQIPPAPEAFRGQVQSGTGELRHKVAFWRTQGGVTQEGLRPKARAVGTGSCCRTRHKQSGLGSGFQPHIGQALPPGGGRQSRERKCLLPSEEATLVLPY